jgi:hypothetical protein
LGTKFLVNIIVFKSQFLNHIKIFFLILIKFPATSKLKVRCETVDLPLHLSINPALVASDYTKKKQDSFLDGSRPRKSHANCLETDSPNIS